MSSQGKTIKCLAAVAWEPKKPLSIEEIEVDPPKAAEVRIKTVATGVCHTDNFYLTGRDPTCQFPLVLGHEGAGIVESIGEGVTTVKPGDHVLIHFLQQCRLCKFCRNPKSNLCKEVQQPVYTMADGTVRFRCKGKNLNQFLGCSTFSEYTVVREIAITKITESAPLDKVCLISCGIPTGYGSAVNVAKVEPGSSCAVFGLGGIGLAAALGCKNAGAKRIIGVDTNSDKFEVAKKFGVNEFVNPKDHDRPIQDVLTEMTDECLDYTFECVGNNVTVKAALEACNKAWGVSVLNGASLENVPFCSFDLISGRTWKGALYGGYKTHDAVPKFVNDYMNKKLPLDDFITHYVTLKDINKSFEFMLSGKSIRTVVRL